MDNVFISRDGKTIVGRAADSNGIKSAAIWQGGKNWRLLGGIPGGAPGIGSLLSLAVGVSADGSVIACAALIPGNIQHACRWDATTGMVDLGSLQGGSSVAWGISGDGRVIVGYESYPVTFKFPIPPNGQRGVIYWAGLERLLHPFGWAGEALATNDVGSVIAGGFHPSDGPLTGTTAYLYTSWDGRLLDLGAARTESNFEYQSRPYGVSNYGEVVVGSTGGNVREASIWTPATGMVRISDYLDAQGVTAHHGWYLTAATYVSPDGKRIAGVGLNPQQLGYSWIVTLP